MRVSLVASLAAAVALVAAFGMAEFAPRALAAGPSGPMEPAQKPDQTPAQKPDQTPAQKPDQKPSQKPDQIRPLPVAVSIAPQRFLLERLAGDDVRVTTVVTSGQSHETYQPTDQQASEVMRASLYFAMGLPLENGRWFESIRRAQRVRVIDCREGITLRELEGHGHDPGQDHGHDEGHGTPGHVCSTDGSDPHVWTTPALLKQQARTMSKALREAAPWLDARLATSLPALEKELDALDLELRTILEPAKGQAFFIFHPAWGYFADAYGIRQIAIEREGKAPSDHELTELQRQARAEGARVVFVQPQISSKAAEAVARAVDGRVEVIDPLEADVPANLRRVARAIAEAIAKGPAKGPANKLDSGADR